MSVVPKRVLMTLLSGLALSFILGAGPSYALEDFRVYRGVLVLEGKIVAGDYDKLRRFLASKPTFEKITGGVFLASPGGNLAEAMKIGFLIRSLRLSTDAPSGPPTGGRKFGESLITPADLGNPGNYECASACFLIFVSGIYRNLYWAGRLGIHRPFQEESELKKLGTNDIAQLNVRIKNLVERYLRQMNVRIKYADLMFSVPSSEVRWITQDELDSDLSGFIPELKDVIDTKCTPPATIAAVDKVGTMAAKQASEIAACRTQVEGQLRARQPLEAWPKVFAGK